MIFIGEIAALSTAFLWAACGMFFTSASKRIGVFSMNHHRVLWGSVLLLVTHFIIKGTVVPIATNNQLLILSVSGILGVVICDSFLFQSYVDIGPRLSMLIFTINPFLTALVAWPMLGEKLGVFAILGMFITLGGTLWVLNEENKKEQKIKNAHYIRGVSFAVLAALFQSLGYVIAKPIMMGENSVDPLSASLVRVFAATCGFWLFGLAGGQTRKIISHMKNKKAMLYLLAGVVTGPFLGIWLSMFALKMAPAGIAATLISTMPIAVLPMVMIAYKEKVSWRAVLGAIIAVVGIVILFNVK